MPAPTERPLALVTGASSGIGVEFAKLFAADGHDLALVARRLDRLETLAAELRARHGIEVLTLAADLGAPGAAAEVVRKIEAAGRRVDVLVNNAGAGLAGRFAEQDPGKLVAMTTLNVTALTELARLVLPGMVARGKGGVLNVASMAGMIPGPFMAVYFASKAYVLALSEALWEECRGTGVTVTALCPGPTRTEFFDRAGMGGQAASQKARMVPADVVARVGVEGLKAGKRVAIPGTANRVAALAVRVVPRGLILRLVRKTQEPKPA